GSISNSTSATASRWRCSSRSWRSTGPARRPSDWNCCCRTAAVRSTATAASACAPCPTSSARSAPCPASATCVLPSSARHWDARAAASATGGRKPPPAASSRFRTGAALPAILAPPHPNRAAMNPNFIDFEQPIAELDAKIQELRHASHGSALSIEDEIGRLQDKLRARTAEIFKALTPWQIAQLSRHPQRPYSNDYFGLILDEFHELAGDRAYADDAAIVGGLGRIDGRSVVVIGQQKGRDTKAKVKRNFGMPRPEGYRKAL